MTDERWTLEKIEDEVLIIIRNEKLLDESFLKSTSLEEIGLDSLALVRILVGIDQNIGVWLEGDALTPENLTDVKSISKYIQTLLQ